MPITNRLRKTLNAAANHHSRRKNDQFIAEGSRCCYEAVSRRPEWIEALFVAILLSFSVVKIYNI